MKKNSVNDFEGSIPYRGLLRESDKVSKDDFIGYLRVLARVEKDGNVSYSDMGQDFFYFKDYTLERRMVGGGKVEPTEEITFEFIDIEIDESKEYYFDMSFMRIPPELTYMGIDDKDGIINLVRHRTVTNMYFGLGLVNIHKKDDPSSIASRTFLEPNLHYDAHDKTDNDNIIDSPDEKTTGGKFGCKKAASFGRDKMPVFKWPSMENSRHPNDTLILMHFGTDNHIGFCEDEGKIEDEDGNKIALIKDAIVVARTMSTDKFGYKIYDGPERYLVSGFKHDYGLHIVKQGNWAPGYWDVH